MRKEDVMSGWMKVSKRQLTNLSISIDEKSENQRKRNQEESIQH